MRRFNDSILHVLQSNQNFFKWFYVEENLHALIQLER